MTDSFTLSDEDVALVEALQIAPRAPWSAVAAAVGTTAGTAVRRWRRLADAGAAWVTGTPGVATAADQCVAYVDVTCSPQAKVAVADELAGDAHAVSVELTAGAADLLVTVAARDLPMLSSYLLDRLDRVPGVLGTRTRIATRLHAEGSGWRLGALPPDRRNRLERWRPPVAASSSIGWSDAVDRSLLVSLGLDGRASYAELAAQAGVSPATARRHTDRLLASTAVRLRTELAAPLAGWPVSVILSADAPAARLDEVPARIGRLRQVRLCATLAGAPNLIVVAWLRAVDEVHRFELALGKSVPDLTITEGRIVLRTIKRMGRLLGSDGRAVGVVPMDVWRDPLAGSAPAGQRT